MANQTAIEWTDLSWNPVHGCSKISPGCAHCYAAELSLRYGHTKKPWTPANAAENVILKPHKLREPLSSAKAWQGLGAAAAAAGKTDGKLVFVNSTSDLFHEQVPFDFIGQALDVMGDAEQHTFQILTKRPERILDFFEAERYGEGWYAFPDNVWVGVSIENRRFVSRADVLRDVPATVKFISAEPLLGPLVNELGYPERPGRAWRWEDGYVGPSLSLDGIDWLIAGGESGRGHRPMDIDWARELRDECHATQHARCHLCAGSGNLSTGPTCFACGGSGHGPGTAFFMKQLGAARPGDRLEDLPEDLRIRDFPRSPVTAHVLEAA